MSVYKIIRAYHTFVKQSALPVLSAPVILVAAVPAYAEFPDHVEAAGLEGKLIWERLEYLREAGVHTAQDREVESNLEARFNEIVMLMNQCGMASPTQWEEDPDYWRMVNAPPIGQGVAGDASPCFCPQEFRVIAGFDCMACGVWPTSGLVATWSSTDAPVRMMSSAITRAEHGEITPFAKFGLIKEGSASITESHSTSNPGHATLGSSGMANHTVTKVMPDHHAALYGAVKNPPIGTTIYAKVDLHGLD